MSERKKNIFFDIAYSETYYLFYVLGWSLGLASTAEDIYIIASSIKTSIKVMQELTIPEKIITVCEELLTKIDNSLKIQKKNIPVEDLKEIRKKINQINEKITLYIGN